MKASRQKRGITRCRGTEGGKQRGCVFFFLPVNFGWNKTDWVKRENQRHTSALSADISSKNTHSLFSLCSPFNSSCERELVAKSCLQVPLNRASEMNHPPPCLTYVLPPRLEIQSVTGPFLWPGRTLWLRGLFSKLCCVFLFSCKLLTCSHQCHECQTPIRTLTTWQKQA